MCGIREPKLTYDTQSFPKKQVNKGTTRNKTNFIHLPSFTVSLSDGFNSVSPSEDTSWTCFGNRPAICRLQVRKPQTHMVGVRYLESWWWVIIGTKHQWAWHSWAMSSWRVLSLCPLCRRANVSIGPRGSWKRRIHTAASVSDAEKVVVVHKTSRLEFEQMKYPAMSEKEIARMVSRPVHDSSLLTPNPQPSYLPSQPTPHSLPYLINSPLLP